MDFGEVLSPAWQIVWKYKVLWIFRILAVCGSGQSNTFNYQFNSNDTNQWFGRDLQLPPFLKSLEYRLENMGPGEVFAFVGAAVCIGIFLAVLGLLLSSLGKIGLIQGTAQAEAGITSLSFRELYESGKPYFWRVVGLSLLIGLAFLVVFGAVGAFFAIMAVITLGLGVLCLLPLICILVPAAWLAGIVIEQATVALVLEDLSITAALERGWQVFRDNLASMVIMGLILGIGLGLIAGFLIGLPMFVVLAPIFYGLVEGGTQAVRSGFLVAGICFVIYLPIAIVLNGVLQAYIKSAWTLTFLRLTAPAAPPPAFPADLDQPAPDLSV